MYTGKDLLRDCKRMARRSGKSTTAAIQIKTLETIYWDGFSPWSGSGTYKTAKPEFSNSDKIEKEITAIRKRLN